MAKHVQGQPPTENMPEQQDADIETKAMAYDEFIALSARVDVLEDKFHTSKDKALRHKNAFEEACLELRELIRRYQHGDSDGGLFTGESNDDDLSDLTDDEPSDSDEIE